MKSLHKLTGVDISFSLRDYDDRAKVRYSRSRKVSRGFRLIVRNLRKNRTELRDITGWDTVRVWRYCTAMFATKHNVSFMDSPRFQVAYAAATEAGRLDHWNAGMHFRIHQALWCADHGIKLGGSLVELGTGRGMTFSAILAASENWEDLSSQVFLFDTFSSAAMNPETGYQDEVLGNSPLYAQSFEATSETFKSWGRVKIVRGYLPGTLSQVDTGPIGFLHIDLNSHVVESDCLEFLWPKLISGAIVLLDDYAHVNAEKQYEAINECATKLGVSVLSLASGQGLLIKP